MIPLQAPVADRPLLELASQSTTLVAFTEVREVINTEVRMYAGCAIACLFLLHWILIMTLLDCFSTNDWYHDSCCVFVVIVIEIVYEFCIDRFSDIGVGIRLALICCQTTTMATPVKIVYLTRRQSRRSMKSSFTMKLWNTVTYFDNLGWWPMTCSNREMHTIIPTKVCGNG